MAESEVETSQELPILTNESFEELPIEEQEVLECFAGGGPRKKTSVPGVLREKIIKELARTEEMKKEYQNALNLLEKKGLVKKTELGGATFYDASLKNRVFLEERLLEK